MEMRLLSTKVVLFLFQAQVISSLDHHHLFLHVLSWMPPCTAVASASIAFTHHHHHHRHHHDHPHGSVSSFSSMRQSVSYDSSNRPNIRFESKGRMCIPKVRRYPVARVMTKRFSTGSESDSDSDSYSDMEDERIHDPNDCSDNDEIHLEDLRRRILITQRQQNEQQDRPEDVYIIVYNPDPDNPNSYLTYKLQFPKGNITTVLIPAFEDEMECLRFCVSLKERRQWFDPKVCMFVCVVYIDIYDEGLSVYTRHVFENEPVSIGYRSRNLVPRRCNAIKHSFV